MISKHTYKNLTWIDARATKSSEIELLREEYNLPELVVEELKRETLRSKVDWYEKRDLVYLVLHFPTKEHTIKGDKHYEQEIDFVIGKNFIITDRWESSEPIDRFAEMFEKNNLFDQREIGDHAGYLFFHIINEFYKYATDQTEEIEKEINSIETDIYRDKEKDMVKRISEIDRKLLNYFQALQLHEDVLKSLELAIKKMFGEGFVHHMSVIIGEFRRTKNHIDNQKQLVNDLRQTNDSLLTSKTNDIMRVLTIMNFIVFPLTLIAGIFGMNTNSDNVMFINTWSDFYIIIAFMALLALVMYWYFKHKKWF